MPGEREPDLGLDRRIETRCTKDLTLVFDQQASLSQLSDRGKVFPVCGNTWCMLADTRFAPHFDFVGNFATHYRLWHVDPVCHKLGTGSEIERRLLLARRLAGRGMKFDLTRRLAAEALGTFFLVMAVVGSGIMASSPAETRRSLSSATRCRPARCCSSSSPSSCPCLARISIRQSRW